MNEDEELEEERAQAWWDEEMKILGTVQALHKLALEITSSKS